MGASSRGGVAQSEHIIKMIGMLRPAASHPNPSGQAGEGLYADQWVSAKRTVTETSTSDAVMSAGNGGNVAPRIIASIPASRSG